MNYASDHYNGKIFLNPVPTEVMQKGSLMSVLKKMLKHHPGRFPDRALGPFAADLQELKRVQDDTVRVTWLGHSSVILEINGKRLLTDPVWYKRVSPFTLLGPKRFFENPVAIDDLPQIDALLLSHDHYDHLDKKSMIRLAAKNIPVITMLGVGRRLRNWGISSSIITELDWWQSIQLNGLTITAAPARHFSGRWLADRFRTLWGSFAIKSETHNVYFGADSGYYEGFRIIGEQLGPFDLTLLEIGAYGDEWASIHMGPESAVQVHQDVKGTLLMPLHWGTFSLAFHPWTEPVERVIKAAQLKNVPLLLPPPGMTCDIVQGAFNSQWWKTGNVSIHHSLQ